jgi:triacylglycerol lipase
MWMNRFRRRRTLAALTTAGMLFALLPGPQATAESDLGVPEEDLAAALECPAEFASSADREPVLLVHGTGVTAEENWAWGYQLDLTARGFDVCLVHLPDRALNDIQVSTEYVVHAIREIAERSGRKVDILGHSQGGLHPRWALRWWPDLHDLVDDVVTLGSPHHGTAATEVSPWQCEACHQMRRDSAYIAALNSTTQTPGEGVSYTSIRSQFDQLVVPEEQAVLEGASNIRIQDRCPGRTVDHLGLAGDSVAHAYVLDAFTNPGPAVLGRVGPGVCTQGTFVQNRLAQSGLTALGVAVGNVFNPSFPNAPLTMDEPPLASYTQDAARGSKRRAGTFRALSYNVAGLWEPISGSEPETNSSLISPLLNDYDLVLLQESWGDPAEQAGIERPHEALPVFFYHHQVVADADHPYRSEPAPHPWLENPAVPVIVSVGRLFPVTDHGDWFGPPGWSDKRQG